VKEYNLIKWDNMLRISHVDKSISHITFVLIKKTEGN